MFIKLLCLLFLFQISFVQGRPHIKILSINNTKCSDTLGKVEYRAKFSCSEYQEIDGSYFMLYYKYGTNNRSSSICKLSLPKYNQGEDSGSNGTEISTQEISTTIPEGVITIPETPESDGAQTQTSTSTDEDTDEDTNIDTDEYINPEKTDSPIKPPIENEDDNLELYLDLLRKNIEKRLGNAAITGENINNLSLDLKVLFDYRVKTQFKTLLNSLNSLQKKIIEFNIKNVYDPLNNSINLLLQKIKDFDYKKIYDKINNTVCSTKQLIQKDINKRMELLQLDTLKDQVEDPFNSSILNDLFTKFSNKSISDLEDSELGKQFLNFTEKIKDLSKNGRSELIRKIDDFQNNIYKNMVDLIDQKISKTTNFVIKHLLIIQDQMNEIKNLRDQYKDKNATANEIIKKLKESMKNNMKKIKDNVLDFIENNEVLKPIIEQIKNAEESMKETVSESEILKKIDAFIGDKKEEIEEFINNYNGDTKSQLQESMSKIQDLLKDFSQGSFQEQISNIPGLASALLEEFKKIIEIDSLLQKLKEGLNGINLEDFNLKDNQNVKEMVDNLKEKSKEFLNNSFLLKLIVDNADKLNDDLKKELEEAGVKEAMQKYIEAIKTLPESLKELNLENNEKLNKTLYDILDKVKPLDIMGILDKLPKSPEDLKELLSKILHLPEDLKEKINENIEKTQETIDEIKDYYEEKKADFEKKLEEFGLKDAYEQYIKGIKDLGKIFDETKLNDNEYLQDLYYKLGDKISENLEKGKEILEELEKIKSKDDFINKVNELTNLDQITEELKNIFDLPKRKENMENLLNNLKENLEDLNDEEIKKIQDKLEEVGLKEPLNEYIKGLKDLLEVVKKNGKIDMEALKEDFYNNQDKLKELLEKAKDLESKLKDLKLDDIKNELKDLTNFEPISNEIKDLFNGTKYFENYKNEAVNVLEELKPYLKELEDKLDTPEMQDVIADIKKSLSSINFNESFSNIEEQLENLNKNIEPLKEELKDIFDIEAIIKDLQNLTSNFSLDNLIDLLNQLNSTTIPDEYKELTSSIYSRLSSITSLLTLVSNNLKNVDLSFLEPLKDAIMNLNGTEMKEKQDHIISLIDLINEELLDIIQNELKDEDKKNKLVDNLENLKESLINLNVTDLNLEEKINSVIEEIKDLDLDTLKEKLSNSDSNIFNNLKEKLKDIEFVKNLENINQLIKDSKLAELLSDEQKKLKEALNNSDFNIIELINEITQNEVIIELKNHLDDLNNLLKALDNTDNREKLNETLYEVVDQIKDFDIKKLQEELAAGNKELLEKLKGLTDIDESFDKIKELMKDSKLGEMADKQKEKLMEKLEELKEKIENTNIIEDLKTQIENNEIIKGLKSHSGDLKKLLESLGNLNLEELKELNGTIYKLKEKIDNKEILDEIAKLPMGDKIVEQIKKLESKLEELTSEKITLESIKDKFNELKEKIGNSKIPESLKTHFNSIKEAINSYKNLASENNAKLKEALYDVKSKVENINGTKMILLLNESIFNFKDDLFEKIGNLNQLKELKDKFLDNLNILNPNGDSNNKIDEFKKNIKEKYTGPLKDKILSMIDNIKEKIEAIPKAIINKIKDKIKDTELYKKYEELAGLSEDLKNNLKNFGKTENFEDLNDIIEQLKDNLSENNVKLVFEKINDSIFSCDTQLNTLIGIKKDIDEMKSKYENSEGKKLIDDSKSEIKIFVQKLKEKVNKLLDEPRFESFSADIKELNASLQESWNKIQEDEYIQGIKKGIEKAKEVLNKIKEQTDLITLNETLYNMSTQSINFIFNESIDKINETKNNYMEEIQKYKDMEKMSERIKYLFETRKNIGETTLDKAKKISEKISEKVKSLNIEKLNEIVDKLNAMNERITGKINGNEVEEQVNKFIEKMGEYEDTINNFPSEDDQSERDKALEGAKKKLFDHTPAEIMEKLDSIIQGNIEALNLTTIIVRIIVKRYQNKPEDVTPEEFRQNINEIILKEFDKLDVPEIKNKEILQEIKDKLDKSLSNTDIPELSKSIQTAIENLKKELGSFKEMYKDKTILEISEAVQKEIKDLNLNGLLDKELSKLKDIQKKIQDVLGKTKIKDILSQINVINTQSKNQLNTFFTRIKKINEKLSSISKSKVLNRTLVAIKKLVSKLNFQKTIELLKSVNISEINPKQEIENVKKIKNLTDEIKEIMDSSPLMNIFGQILFENLNRKLSEKKMRILQTDSSNELTCKIDDVPNSDTITSEPQNINPFILNNEVYNISLLSQIKIDIKNNNFATCGQNKITELYNNIIYKSHDNLEVDYSKNRIKFKLYTRFVRNFTLPNFFYLYLKIKLNLNKNRILKLSEDKSYRRLDDEELETDSYCVLEDLSNISNVELSCHSFLDSLENGQYNITNITSNYFQMPSNTLNNSTNSTNSTNNRNYGYAYYRTSKSGLSAGAIVGIILGSLAALLLVLGIIFCLRRNSKSTVYPTQSINMSYNNKMVPTEQGVSVDLSQKNFHI